MRIGLILVIGVSTLIGLGCSKKKNDPANTAAANTQQTQQGVNDNRICSTVPECARQCESLYPSCAQGAQNCNDNTAARSTCLNSRVGQILMKPGGGDVVLAANLVPMSFIPQGSTQVDFSAGIVQACDGNGVCELFVRTE
jgi:hypothetical protein